MRYFLTKATFAGMLLLTGCATPYLPDRGRDAADIFSFRIETGIGAKARIGPLAGGLYVGGHPEAYFVDMSGVFVNRQAFYWENCSPKSVGEPLSESVVIAMRHKDFCADSFLFHNYFPVPFVQWPKPSGHNLAYYTQFEVVVGLWLAPRFGFNPGELLDFLVGWVGIDLYDDDLKGRLNDAFVDAASRKDEEAVRNFLKNGAPPDAVNRYGHTALMEAANKDNLSLVELFLAHGADPNFRIGHGMTALMWAATSHQADVVKVLIAHGADVNARDSAGLTVLMHAAAFGGTEVVQVLLAHGADANAKNKYGDTASQYAKRLSVALGKEQERQEVIRLLGQAEAEAGKSGD